MHHEVSGITASGMPAGVELRDVEVAKSLMTAMLSGNLEQPVEVVAPAAAPELPAAEPSKPRYCTGPCLNEKVSHSLD